MGVTCASQAGAGHLRRILNRLAAWNYFSRRIHRVLKHDLSWNKAIATCFDTALDRVLLLGNRPRGVAGQTRYAEAVPTGVYSVNLLRRHLLQTNATILRSLGFLRIVLHRKYAAPVNAPFCRKML